MSIKQQPKKRGLGSSKISPARRRQIQSMGGKASHGGGRRRPKLATENNLPDNNG